VSCPLPPNLITCPLPPNEGKGDMEEARIKKVRRMAEKQGLILRRSRKDGTWLVIDAATNTLVMSTGLEQRDGTGGLALEDVERGLREGETDA
jgi:hypothetical protein